MCWLNLKLLIYWAILGTCFPMGMKSKVSLQTPERICYSSASTNFRSLFALCIPPYRFPEIMLIFLIICLILHWEYAHTFSPLERKKKLPSTRFWGKCKLLPCLLSEKVFFSKILIMLTSFRLVFYLDVIPDAFVILGMDRRFRSRWSRDIEFATFTLLKHFLDRQGRKVQNRLYSPY